MNLTSVDFNQPSVGWLDEMWGQLEDTSHEEEPLEEQLADQCGLTDESKLASVYASHYLLPLFEPPSGLAIPVDRRLQQCLPADFCEKHEVVPLAVQDHSLEVAIASPSALLLADEVRRLSGLQMRPLFARATVVRRACHELFGDLKPTPKNAEATATASAVSTVETKNVKRQSIPQPPPVEKTVVASPMNLTAYDLRSAERSAWQKQLVADSGLTIYCGRKGLDKSPLARLWGVWSSQTHGRPASRWNPLQRESVESDPSVVIIPDLNSPTSAEVCLHSVLQGQRVFAVVHARDPVSAILRLRAWGQIGHSLAEQINLLIHQNGLSRSECRSIEIDDVRRSALASENDMGRLQKLFPSTGSFLCGP
ncbi:ATPase, T2SS/T4P/T4SS family [Rhodopirellula baltica]|uniref:Type IV pilus assembly protein TapB n=2 Tax=Rhodopirellula baltica TaxID=265606 RepID=F2AYM4_RHOBT|nr:type II/IV secretion system protein [Rhodopirellula baltica]EGF25221.1 type IV pilus assembly protein TapB [Rhodopirellula baltica WH47]CAD73613.1 similar to type IV pilus assembly protein TapB [Rhodopirellula baltica SH 1]HBE62070.1 pilus assembly protein TapB [Rhodopirellula baltica]